VSGRSRPATRKVASVNVRKACGRVKSNLFAIGEVHNITIKPGSPPAIAVRPADYVLLLLLFLNVAPLIRQRVDGSQHGLLR